MCIKIGYLESMDLLLSRDLEIKEKEIAFLPITISYLGEICAPLRYYAAYNGNFVSTFQDNLSHLNFLTLEMRPIFCPKVCKKLLLYAA
jgi:hypothetical protein